MIIINIIIIMMMMIVIMKNALSHGDFNWRCLTNFSSLLHPQFNFTPYPPFRPKTNNPSILDSAGRFPFTRGCEPATGRRRPTSRRFHHTRIPVHCGSLLCFPTLRLLLLAETYFPCHAVALGRQRVFRSQRNLMDSLFGF